MTLKRMFGALAMSIVAIVMSLAVASPAMAYDDYFSTNDGDPGGRLWWTANGDIVTICDIEEDGWAVYASVHEIRGGQYYLKYEFEVGGNGNCKTNRASEGGSHDLQEGVKIKFYLCLDRTIDGEQYCDRREWWNTN